MDTYFFHIPSEGPSKFKAVLRTYGLKQLGNHVCIPDRWGWGANRSWLSLSPSFTPSLLLPLPISLTFSLPIDKYLLSICWISGTIRYYVYSNEQDTHRTWPHGSCLLRRQSLNKLPQVCWMSQRGRKWGYECPCQKNLNRVGKVREGFPLLPPSSPQSSYQTSIPIPGLGLMWIIY